MIILKSPRELALMRRAGRIVARVLDRFREVVRPGITTAELEEVALQIIEREGGIPSFKGYRGYPAAICASINEEVVHGIPSPKRVLKEGDIVSLDVGAIYKGYHGDAAITLPVGAVSEEVQRLLEVTQGALHAGIAQAHPGNRLGDISAAIQRYVESRGFNVVREYTGHGIGQEMHEEPQIPNFGPPNRGPRLRPGMTMALEPMVTAGDWRTRTLSDGWTVVTADGSLSAHFEHTIAITDGEPEILTRL
ncbi:MAG TPA: type I methionyl aminopeptidase [Chloroflexi bacterium]|nr:type I methionyl aminopeptidase [Chloroflexota bacterium]